MNKWSIDNVSIITPDSSISNGCLTIADDKIENVSKKSSSGEDLTVEIENAVVCPGFINAHDHLLGTYYPKVGNGPYPNWLPWDNDLKSADVYRERQQLENRDLYLLGGYRNLISGVTSVQDHIPHFVQDPYLDILPVKVISEFTMAHAVASFALNWGEGIEKEYQTAIENDIPFVTHISEGFDPETIKDLETLNSKGALGDHSVLIHGIAFSESDMSKIKSKNANVVWCADSNIFMFEKTTNIKMLLDKKINVCIGTDSPMSGGLNLLHEIKFDKDYYLNTYEEELSDKQIVKMITKNPAKAFRLYDNGEISAGKLADLVVIEKTKHDSYASVVNAELENIMLVVIEGMPIYANTEYSYLFDEFNISYQNININGVDKIIVGDLIGVLERINKAVGFKKEFPFLPINY